MDFPDITRVVPGALGSLFSMLWIKDTWQRMVVMFFGGIAMAYYGSTYAVKVTGLDSGIAGFLLGLFGMSLISSVFEGYSHLEVMPLIKEKLRQLLRLPPKAEDTK